MVLNFDLNFDALGDLARYRRRINDKVRLEIVHNAFATLERYPNYVRRRCYDNGKICHDKVLAWYHRVHPHRVRDIERGIRTRSWRYRAMLLRERVN
jgi:hypothetical protein